MSVRWVAAVFLILAFGNAHEYHRHGGGGWSMVAAFACLGVALFENFWRRRGGK